MSLGKAMGRPGVKCPVLQLPFDSHSWFHLSNVAPHPLFSFRNFSGRGFPFRQRWE